MPTVAPADARALATAFRELAEAVEGRLFGQWEGLSPDEHHALQERARMLLQCSSDMTNVAIDLAVDDLAASLAGIRDATAQLTDAVRHTADVRRAITLVAAAVTLGKAVVTGDVHAIASAVAGAVRAVRQPVGPGAPNARDAHGA